MRKNITMLALVAVGAACVSASTGFLRSQFNKDGIDQLFNLYLARYSKSYSTKEEYLQRRAVFERQFNLVQEHNAQNGVSYTLGLNKFSDLTTEEFERNYLGDSGAPEDESADDSIPAPKLSQQQVFPIDWRTKGAVGPVKDQGHCGSCWSFSTAGPIEEHYAIKYGKQVVLAEQQLVECSWAFGNNGCNGGLFANGYAYVKQYGLELNSTYPYIANDTAACRYDPANVVVNIAGTVSAIRSADGLKAALMNGPASVSLHASTDSFRNYKSGVFEDYTCPTTVNHAVQSIGWGTEGGKDYFIIRNSWGPSWGDQGYIKMAAVNTDLGICGLYYRVPMQPIIV